MRISKVSVVVRVIFFFFFLVVVNDNRRWRRPIVKNSQVKFLTIKNNRSVSASSMFIFLPIKNMKLLDERFGFESQVSKYGRRTPMRGLCVSIMSNNIFYCACTLLNFRRNSTGYIMPLEFFFLFHNGSNFIVTK